jgi:hypothetical protein
MITKAFAVSLVLAGAALACGRNADRRLLERLGARGCNPNLIILADSANLDSHTACELATVALDYLGQGNGRALGVAPADTSRLRRAAVARFDIPSLDGGAPESYWHIAFPVPTKEYAIAVRIERPTGRVFVERAEWDESLLKR